MNANKCPRCDQSFECKPDDIENCHCNQTKVALPTAVTKNMSLKYNSCLCSDCISLFTNHGEAAFNELSQDVINFGDLDLTVSADTENEFHNLNHKIQNIIDLKTKPIGSLGMLERLVKQIGLIQKSEKPQINLPSIVVFAADHGYAQSGLSKYPSEVTAQMILNFTQNGAAINSFCRQNDLKLIVVDAGVNYDFDPGLPIIHKKIAKGTSLPSKQPAMNTEQFWQAFKTGQAIVGDIHSQGCNTIGFGEMGIGNTSAAALVMHAITSIEIEKCVGRGTGLDDQQLQHKTITLKKIYQNLKNQVQQDPILAMQYFGGFEMVMMMGAYCQAAQLGMLILVDGFIASVCFLAAMKLNPLIKKYAIFCHKSEEQGHSTLLRFMQADPLLDIGMRLGEGSGIAVAYPIIKSALSFYDNMSSFAGAGVSQEIHK